MLSLGERRVLEYIRDEIGVLGDGEVGQGRVKDILGNKSETNTFSMLQSVFVRPCLDWEVLNCLGEHLDTSVSNVRLDSGI
jgi:hypothetical protein